MLITIITTSPNHRDQEVGERHVQLFRHVLVAPAVLQRHVERVVTAQDVHPAPSATPLPAAAIPWGTEVCTVL